jgi:hypothetical protein
MEFTFGIITDGTQDIFLQLILNSIYEENIPHYEVIIVGNTNIIVYVGSPVTCDTGLHIIILVENLF